MYDIFFISDSKVNVSSWNIFKARFPHAQKIENCESYEILNKKTLTKNFWVVWDCLHLTQDFDFTYRLTEWDNQYIHVFKNGEHYDGVCLFPKNLNVTNKEWKYRFFTNKKEIDIVASQPKPYDIVKLDSYNGLVTAQEIAHSDFLLCIPDDVVPTDIPQYQVPAWDKDVVHVFKNNKTYDGIFICHKNNKIAKREFDYRFFTNKKEIDIVASNPKKWEVFNLETFDDYKQALEKATGDMFWGVYSDLNISDNFKFDYYIPKYDSYHRKLTHCFQNSYWYDGVTLFSKERPVTEREFKSRFFTNKKDIKINSSVPTSYDIAFISYKEKNADKHFNELQDIIRTQDPTVKLRWIRDVKGIHQAHIAAAELCDTNMFWVVDGDAKLIKHFKFNYRVPFWDQDMVHVWRSKNAVNDLEYGYGGVKLLPRKAVIGITDFTTDMTTSLSPKFKAMNEVSNISVFDTDEYSTWKSAFRECVKLASRAINRQDNMETDKRLDIWCKEAKGPFAEYALKGAKAGRAYGVANSNKPDNLRKINDFDWLKEQFNAR